MYALIFTDGIRFYRGDFIVILAPIFGAIHVLVTSKITKNISINITLLYQFITVTIVAFVVALFTQSSLTIESVNLFLALSYLGFFVTTFRYFAEIFSMRKIDPTNVTLVMLLTPLWSALFAYVFLDEVPSTQQYFGCLLILIGLLGVQLFRKERRLTAVEIE